MTRLALALLLLVPSLAFGQTIKLPAEIVATQDAVLIQPEYSDATQVKDIKWAVLGLKAAPSFSYLTPPFVAKANTGIMLRSPAPGDEVTIVVLAQWTSGKLSDPVITTVKRGAGTGSATPPPANPPTTPISPAQPPPGVDRDLPANTQGISAILVVDPANVAPEFNTLAVGPNAVTKALGRGNGAFYVRNSTDTLVTRYPDLMESLQGKQLPAVVIIDAKPNPRKVVNAVSITATGSADLTAKQIITQIANALGP